MEKRYRDIKDKLVIGTLNKLIAQDTRLTLWQPTKSGKKMLWQATISFMNPKKKFITCSVRTDDEYAIPNIDKPLYMANVRNQDIAFKCELKSFTKNSVKLTFPKEIKAIENREAPRRELKFSDNKRCQLWMTNYRDKKENIDLRILDISKTGIGAVFSKHLLGKIKKDMILILNTIDGRAVVENDLKVKYIRKMKVKLEGSPIDLYRIGLESEDEIASRLLEY